MIKIDSTLFLLLFFILLSCQNKDEDKELSFPVKSQKDEQKTKVQLTPYKNPEFPENANFCGELVPINDATVKERLDRELIVNNFYHSRTFLTLKRSGRWFPMIEKTLKKYNIPEDFKYMAVAESALENVRSYKGAMGFWQIMKRTAREYDLEVNRLVDERLHVKKSTEAACQYLQNAYKKLGSWTLVAAAYNRGVAGIKRNLDEQHVGSYFDLFLNEETSRYVYRLIATKLIFENPENYGFNIKKEDYYSPYKTKTIEVDETIRSLQDWARKQNTTYKNVKILNPWIVRDRLRVIGDDSYPILLPAENSTLKKHSP